MKYLLICIMAFSFLFALASPYSQTTTARHTMQGLLSRSEEGCTSLCINDGNEGCVFGTNLDNTFSQGQLFVNKRGTAKIGWELGTTGRRAVWISTYGSLTFNLVGYQYAWAGMNEAGLMISTMALSETENPRPDERPPLQSPYWVQFQLDNCATVREVIEQDSHVRIKGTVDHYLVADKAGNCAVIEFLEGNMVCHTGATLPISVLTNNTYEESLRAWKEKRVYVDSIRRFVLSADKVKNFTPCDMKTAVEYTFSILSLVSSRLTNWSIVFDDKSLQVSYFTKRNPQIRHIDLDDLDFSCRTPVRMLNIDEATAGDVTGAFGVYSHQAALVQMTNALKVFAPGLPESQVEALLGFFEGFSCAQSLQDVEKK